MSSVNLIVADGGLVITPSCEIEMKERTHFRKADLLKKIYQRIISKS